jgi:hypothetical protein
MPVIVAGISTPATGSVGAALADGAADGLAGAVADGVAETLAAVGDASGAESEVQAARRSEAEIPAMRRTGRIPADYASGYSGRTRITT